VGDDARPAQQADAGPGGSPAPSPDNHLLDNGSPSRSVDEADSQDDARVDDELGPRDNKDDGKLGTPEGGAR
jgi:hypothetical protein